MIILIGLQLHYMNKAEMRLQQARRDMPYRLHVRVTGGFYYSHAVSQKKNSNHFVDFFYDKNTHPQNKRHVTSR